MRPILGLPLLFLVLPAVSFAAANEGGTLVLHVHPSIVYSQGETYGGQADVTSCGEINACASGDDAVVFALAAFPATTSPELRAIQFGIQYDESLVSIADHGHSALLEYPTVGWPAPGTGVTIWWGSAQTSHLTEVGWFALETEPGTVAQFAVAEYVTGTGVFRDNNSNDPGLDSIEDYGVVGFNASGYVPCPDDPLSCANEMFAENGLAYSAQNGDTVTVYVDPGADDFIDLEIAQVNSPGTITADITVTSARTGTILAAFPQVDLSTNYMQLGPIAHSRRDGFVQVDIAASVPSDGNRYRYVLRPRVSGAEDRIYSNGNAAYLALDPASRDQYSFYVPSYADTVRIHAFLGMNVSDVLLNVNSVCAGISYFAPIGTTTDTPVTPLATGCEWQFDFLYYGPDDVLELDGLLEIEFGTNGTFEAPTFALRADPDSDLDPLMAYLSPHQTVTVDGDLFFAPREAAAGSPGAADPPTCDHDSSYLTFLGRQEFLFATKTADVRYVKIRALDTLWVASGTRRDEIVPEQVWEEFVTAEAPLAVRIARAGYYSIETSAEYAVTGPHVGLALGTCASNDPPFPIDPVRFEFFVPDNQESIRLTVASGRTCRNVGDLEECGDDGYFFPVHPPVEVRLFSPGQSVTHFQTDADGNLTISHPTSPGHRGRVWALEVETTQTYSGHTIEIAYDDGFLPYLAWQPDALMVPLAQRRSKDFFYLDTESQVDVSWSYWSKRFLAATGYDIAGQSSVWFGPPEGLVTTPISRDDTVAHNALVTPKARTWMGAETSQPAEDIYLLARAVGVTPTGQLRTSIGGAPGDTTTFLGVEGSTSCGDGPQEPCETEYQDLVDRGFLLNSGGDGEYGWSEHGILKRLHWGGGSSGVNDWTNPNPDWVYVENVASYFGEKDYVLTRAPLEEPLALGLSRDRLARTLYHMKNGDQRHPYGTNEEPGLLATRELRDLMEYWAEEQYIRRGNFGDNEEPLCSVVQRLQLIRRNVPEKPQHLFILGGYEEKGLYKHTSVDEAASALLSLIILDVDMATYFTRFWGDHDLAAVAPDVWASFLETIPLAHAMIDRVNEPGDEIRAVWFTGSGVVECEIPPVIVGRGELTDEPSGGTWLFLANLSGDDKQGNDDHQGRPSPLGRHLVPARPTGTDRRGQVGRRRR